MHKWIVLKTVLNFNINTAPVCFSLITITTVTLANSNNALPNDGD